MTKFSAKKNISDKTKELNKKLKNSSSELQKSVVNKNYVEKLVIFKEQVTDKFKYDSEN